MALMKNKLGSLALHVLLRLHKLILVDKLRLDFLKFMLKYWQSELSFGSLIMVTDQSCLWQFKICDSQTSHDFSSLPLIQIHTFIFPTDLLKKDVTLD